MQEGLKTDKNLSNKTDDFHDDVPFDNETEILKLLEALSEKIKFLENLEGTPKIAEKANCDFKHTCYAAKSKMGPCPCELYR
jgi:hypothetical protein